MTKHWPLLDTEGAHTGWSGSRRTGRPWGIASCTSPRSSGWTSSQRCAERSCKASQPQVQLKTEGGGGAKARRERRPTRGRTLPPSRATVRPRCPPSWCGTQSSSSPWPSQCIPSAGAAPCWRLCRPDMEGNQKVYHNRSKLADIRSNENWRSTCSLNQSSLSPLKSNSSLSSTSRSENWFYAHTFHIDVLLMYQVNDPMLCCVYLVWSTAQTGWRQTSSSALTPPPDTHTCSAEVKGEGF